MNNANLTNDKVTPIDDGACNHLTNLKIPAISLPNQYGNLLKLNRTDTFRIILFCYSMTGNPKQKLPTNWGKIPGAVGCTSENCSIRDNYDEIVALNAIPIGICSQSSEDIREMVIRLNIQYDVLSDSRLAFSNLLNLPTFEADSKIYIKRLTLIVEKSTIKKFFYPVFPADKHIYEVIEWLKAN
tara:strand:+ start:51 stop:605 length:555 start_codon:yes stop_codon:yes gene_type:complete